MSGGRAIAVAAAAVLAVPACLYLYARSQGKPVTPVQAPVAAGGERHIVLYYRYCHIEDPAALREWQIQLAGDLGLTGRVLIAREGVNGTLSGAQEAVASYITAMEQHRGPEQGGQQQYMFKDVDWKCSSASVEPFPDLKIAVVKEVVSTGGRITAPQDTPQEGGRHLSPEDFHQALQDDNIVLIDVRNKNEFDIGHFEGATNPKTRTFSEFPKYLDDHAKNWKADKKKVLMYCTGGIRCEKASIMVKAQGVEEVFQLAGGIHRYLERYPDGGRFLGKNLVFDRRVAMCSENTTVVGRCVNCSGPWDSFQGNRVCCVCRDPILACPPCQKREKGVLYCEEHMYLKHVYYYFIDGFTAVELEGQRMALEALAYGMTGGVGQDSKRHKNKRRTIRNQIGKIEQRLEGLNSGSVSPEVRPGEWRCRTCGEWSPGCNGNCWGYWKEPETAAGGAASEQEARKISHKTHATDREQGVV